MDNQENTPKNEELKPDSEGIDKWNERLDENQESEQAGDLNADEKARKFSAEHGSGNRIL